MRRDILCFLLFALICAFAQAQHLTEAMQRENSLINLSEYKFTAEEKVLLDDILVKFFKKCYPKSANVEADFRKFVLGELPASLVNKLDIPSFIFYIPNLQRHYTIEANGKTLAYNERITRLSEEYHLHGMSEAGLDFFRTQHVQNSSFFEPYDDKGRINPVKKRPAILALFKANVSESDLAIIEHSWTLQEKEYEETQRKFDSVYFRILPQLQPAIDSVGNLYQKNLAIQGKAFLSTLPEEIKAAWKKTAFDYEAYTGKWYDDQLKEQRKLGEEFSPNTITYLHLLRQLMVDFPSCGFYEFLRYFPNVTTCIPKAQLAELAHPFLDSYYDYMKAYDTAIKQHLTTPAYAFIPLDDERVAKTNAIIFAFLHAEK